MRRLATNFIKFPANRRDTAQAIEQFKLAYSFQISQAIGAIDGTHVNIVAPAGEGEDDYFSRKKRYTVNTQGIVGANLVFYDVATGFPGSCHDARNLKNSSISHRAQNEELLVKPIDIVNETEIRPLILGDNAYPLFSWLLTPFPFGPALKRRQKKFNKRLSGGESKRRESFWHSKSGILKARWRCLLKRVDNEIENVSSVIMRCCTIHNICQINNESYIDRDGVLERILRQERESRQDYDANPDGNTIRSVIVDYVNE
ncbi:uncharacterized protein [Clytia hemisphaerica]|uniref:uncharacterized protein n=1 Tax=Clytia hemisphaerica TaxID=252671 RepID=UPI0034D74F7F